MTSQSPPCRLLKRALSDQVDPHTPLPVYVGLSGGLDSNLLLHCACNVFGAKNVVAIHVHHGLSPNADHWQTFCEQETAKLGCTLVVEHGKVQSSGLGIEAAARRVRYQSFAKHVKVGHKLLLAHHLDDQVETFFLRMMRGSGLHGLKAMSAVQDRDQYKLCRPWLGFSRHQLEQAAKALGLSWVEDESNKESQFDRNFLRNEVLPLLESRWSTYRERVNTVIDEIVSQDQGQHPTALNDQLEARLSFDGGLKWVQLEQWPDADKLSLLHLWLTRLNVPVASKVRLQHVLANVIEARADADPKVRMGDGYIRRHGPAIYWVPEQSEIAEPPPLKIGRKQWWSGVGSVEVRPTKNTEFGLDGNLANLHWRLRRGGEQIRPVGRSKRRDLKRLLQEYRIKPWQRDRLPLLYSGDTLVAVADLFVSAEHLADEESSALEVIWQNS